MRVWGWSVWDVGFQYRKNKSTVKLSSCFKGRGVKGEVVSRGSMHNPNGRRGLRAGEGQIEFFLKKEIERESCTS